MTRDGEATDGESSVGLTRRKVLYGLTATATAATSGVGTAAVMHLSDDEREETTATTGTVDLETEWIGSGSVVGDEETGIERTRFWVPSGESNNPVYVWVKTRCPTGNGDSLPIERVVLDTGESEYTLLSDVTYEDVREAFGGGKLLHVPGVNRTVLPPLEPRAPEDEGSEGAWELRFEWSVGEGTDLPDDSTVHFALTFHAVQSRNVDISAPNPDAADPEPPSDYWPDWSGCDEEEEEDEAELDGAVSHVAFGSDEMLVADDFATLELVDGGDAVRYEMKTTAPEIGEVVVKHKRYLDVFEGLGDGPVTISVRDDGSGDRSVANGDGVRYEMTQSGTEYADTDPLRTVNQPIPPEHHCEMFKRDFDGGTPQDVSKNVCESQ